MRTVRLLAAAVVVASMMPLTSCGQASSAGNPKMVTWPLDTVSVVSAPVTASGGGRVSVNSGATTIEVVFPPGSFAEDAQVELLPLTGPPLKDGVANLSDGFFVRRAGDGVNAPPALEKPAELHLTVAGSAPPGGTIVRWSLSKGTAEAVKTSSKNQGSSTVLSASLGSLGGYGARAIK